MAENNDIPAVPLPPDDVKAGAAVPPVEPAPAAPAAPATPTAPGAPAAAYGAPPTTPPAPPAYGSPTAYGQPAYAAAPAGPAQGLSITSMVLGLVGLLFSLFFFGFLPALAAVITGHLAQRRQPYARGFWITGLITGYIGLLIAVISLVGLIAFVWIASSSSYYY